MRKYYFFLAFLLLASCNDTDPNLSKTPIDYVSPFIGTDGHGHTFPGATMPFGMVQLSPDTRLEGWDGCSGYHYTDHVVYGFSHTHLSGTGVADYCDVLFMPTVGEVLLDNGSEGEKGYSSKFSHEKETASPGYYSVFLEDYQVEVELTTTKRVGIHKYAFPDSKEANIILDLVHRDKVLDSGLKIISDTEIEGYRISNSWAKEQHIYFVAEFSQPFKSSGIANEKGEIITTERKGEHIKAFFQFETNAEEPVMVRVGISAVSIDGARKNLAVEGTHWDFNAYQKEAEAAWDKSLSKITVSGRTEEEKTTFYSALYHTMIAPNLFMDVDKQYRSTGKTVEVAKGNDQYTIFSLWDTYRASHPLYSIIEQDLTHDFIQSMLNHHKDGGVLPMWELAGDYTGCMIGYHAVPVIVDAYAKKIRGFDAKTALAAMKHAAERDVLGIDHYRINGFVPIEEEGESVSKTLEYAYDDWCIAEMARLIGDQKTYDTYIKRAQYYKNMYDPESGFMRGKLNHNWFTPFNPAEVNFNYTEANAWQYLFYAPQDITGMIEMMGGEAEFEKRVDGIFEAEEATTGRDQVDMTGLIGQYVQGNEPSHHVAYLYNYIGKPYKTQARVGEIMNTLFSDKPDGLPGNDDCGQMSAWYVLSALGFYSVTPGQTIYAIGAPYFPEASINLENGNVFTVQAKDVSAQNIYIQSATLNGEPFDQGYIDHAQIMAGGNLSFVMGPNPNKDWGSQKIPVSAIPKEKRMAATPYLNSPYIFEDTLLVELKSIDADATIYYQLGKAAEQVFKEPFMITKATPFNFYATIPNGANSQRIETELKQIPAGRKVAYKEKYAPEYSAGGDRGLIDLVRGSADFRNGTWQGIQGGNLEAVLDLGKSQRINTLGLGCLQDTRSWIFMPNSVQFEYSTDGENYLPYGEAMNETKEKTEEILLAEFTVKKRVNARYIRITANNRMTNPGWHLSPGEPTWIFFDEILVK